MRNVFRDLCKTRDLAFHGRPSTPLYVDNLRFLGLDSPFNAISSSFAKVFLDNRMLQAAAERFFILAIEIIVDIGEHLLHEQVNVTVESYKDIISQLGKHDLVPINVCTKNAHMTGFRNLLVHAYEEIDPTLVYNYLLSAPKEFRAFAKAFSKFL